MKENRSFRKGKNPDFVTALDLIKCLKQVKYQRLLITCAPIGMSKLPSNISTIVCLSISVTPTKVLYVLLKALIMNSFP